MPTNTWIYNSTATPARMQVDATDLDTIYGVSHSGATYSYSPSKSYQIITSVCEVYSDANASFSVSPAWSDTMNYSNGATTSDSTSPIAGATQCFLHYSSPSTLTETRNQVTYRANGTFSDVSGVANRGITNFKINELDFKIIGYSYYKVIGNGYELQPNLATSSRGWYYDSPTDIYFWFDRSEDGDISFTSCRYQPVGGIDNNKVPHVGYRLNNCLYKFIPYSSFNFSFYYQNAGNFPLYVYTSQIASSTSPVSTGNITGGQNTYIPSDSVLLATLTQSVGTFSVTDDFLLTNFYGISGNQYLMFVGGYAGYTSSVTYSAIYIKNLRVDGGYHSGNNREYLMDTSSPTYSTTLYGLTGATYTALIATGNTVNATASLENPGISQINSKIGNGTFQAGIWENGVWNSGWRVDDNMYEFYDVYQYFVYKQNKRWRLQITGPSSSVAEFSIGDNVAISNIVSIDINEDRKLLKGYYTVINKTTDSLIVEFDNNFPLRRVERDSEHHRIYITKNVWLSGAFLNGYFQGIWNYGLFKGYPLITEMFNSHWIDGVFDGGHFYSEKYNIPDFADTVFQSGKVGLTFSQPHKLAVNDTIYIDKYDKTVNSQYDGYHSVTEVIDDYQIVTEIDWGSDSVNETGKITSELNTGLLQNLNFKSNNLSKITSVESLESDAVFLYNSWLDLVFDNSSATNIGKPQTKLNSISRKTYSENNLYGWITNDVLESSSSFRDSFSTTSRSYKLGTKYKTYSDFIGDSGSFEDEFSNDAEFMEYGWTYSKYATASMTFSRTNNEELKVQTIGDGGFLDIQTPEVEILNRTEEDIEKFRYTKIEFDLNSYIGATSGNSSKYTFDKTSESGILVPFIYFNNLNIINRDVVIGTTVSIEIKATYLPIYDNVDHIGSTNKKKVEYFYNKRNLGMSFRGFWNSYPFEAFTSEFIIDNLHFYEVDMIPFFQYFTEDNINKSVAVPYQALSPFIDYTNPNFNFINNISIGLDSITTVNSYTPIGGIGIGIDSNSGVNINSGFYISVTASSTRVN